MVKQSVFTKKRELISSYDFFDIASGTGFVSYLGVNAIDSTGNNYILFDESLSSIGSSEDRLLSGGSGSTNQTVVNGNSGQCIDIDFDLTEFQKPQTIKGMGIVRFCLGSDLSASNAGVFVVAKLRKWDGSNEIELVSVTSATDATMNLNTSQVFILQLAIPQTHFKKGDFLRLTIQVTSTDNNQLSLVHCPKDVALTGSSQSADIPAGESKMILSIPYRLDFM